MKSSSMPRHLAVLGGVGLLFVGLGAQPVSLENARKLQERITKSPEADANRDGVLTQEEARAHQKSARKAKVARATAAAVTSPTPSFANVSYGPHARNVLDVWQATSERPAPVLIFFHGGAFKAGDKANVLSRPIFEECRTSGITVISANYRFTPDAPFPAQMHDGARVVQWVRSQAKEWNLDPERIALSGTSAGATLALWISLHDDFADPASNDPVSRQSTRVTCASPHNGTAGLEVAYFKEQAGIIKLGGGIYQLFGVKSQEALDAPDKRALMRDASAVLHVTRDDPPLFLTYAGNPEEAPFAADTPQNAWIHHVSLGTPLKKRYDELGLACEFHYKSKPAPAGAEIAFLKKHLLR